MARPTTERNLKAWLARKLGLQDVQEVLWERLRDRSYVRVALESGKTEDYDALVDEARDLTRTRTTTATGEGRERPDNSNS